jgi:threonine/homoserine/homoserine lactone efflux protein
MSLQLYLAFVAACIALALLPGPMVTLVIANGLRHGGCFRSLTPNTRYPSP